MHHGKNLARYYRALGLFRRGAVPVSRYLNPPANDDGMRDFGVSADALRAAVLENRSLNARESRVLDMYHNNYGSMPTTPREYLSPQPFDDGSEDLGISGDLLRLTQG